MDHSKEFEKIVADIMPNVTEITVEETLGRINNDAVLIDVREDNEWEDEHAKDAIHIGRGVIERDIIHKFPNKETELILYCGGGYRSALAADNLQKMGYTNVFSMKGGWTAWKEAEAPMHDYIEDNEELLREKMKEIATEYIEKGDFYGWFDAVYRETENDSKQIPWVDLEPNRFLVEWNKTANLQGNNRKALVVGCGLGDEAKFLDDLNFDVTAFDVSEKAIEIAGKIHKDADINFLAADLFDPPKEWKKAFDLVVEVYTIQALPLSLREKTIEQIASFVAENGELIVVQRFRENNEEPEGLPWALSPDDLSNFEKNGLTQTNYSEFYGDDDDPIKRFVAEYKRSE